MLLTVDIGNTNIVLGAFKEDNLLFVSRISTDKKWMADQYAIAIKQIIELYGLTGRSFDGAIISSVVPPVFMAVRNAVTKVTGCEPLAVGPGLKTGLNIKIDDPSVLGSDMVCSAVGALSKYNGACIIFDLGTATKISAVDKNKSFLGGSIMPGVGISLDALSAGAAQLPYIGLDSPQAVKLIGTNTIDSMRSGILLGTADMVDGMFRRYKELLGEDAVTLMTGGMSAMIKPFCKTDAILDNTLILDGLRVLYQKIA